MKFTAEHVGRGNLIIRDQNGKFIAMSYAPTTQEEKDTLELILNAPVMRECFNEINKLPESRNDEIKEMIREFL